MVASAVIVIVAAMTVAVARLGYAWRKARRSEHQSCHEAGEFPHDLIAPERAKPALARLNPT
jgi:hypothetical protein